MNELIQALASKANFGHINKGGEDVEFDPRLAVFAELIVRECMSICEEIDSDCSWEIGQHFGVEE